MRLLLIFSSLAFFIGRSHGADVETTLNTGETLVTQPSATTNIDSTQPTTVSEPIGQTSPVPDDTNTRIDSGDTSSPIAAGGSSTDQIQPSASGSPDGCATCSCATCGKDDDPSLASKLSSNPCEIGECVPYYLCLNGSIITSGEGILDVRLGADDDPEPERHPCPEFFDTCCLLKSDGVVKEHINPPTITTEKPDKCGIRNKKGAAFTLIERENESQFGEFPWVTAIIQKIFSFDVFVNIYRCGGSLIHPSVVMTAAHCVRDLNNTQDVLIRVGEWDTQTMSEPLPHQDRGVVEILIHEQYHPRSHFNNIALLFLDKPVELAENINTACLPPQDFTFDNQRCFATGWGKDKFGKDGIYQVILKRVELPVVSHDACQNKLRETRLGRHFILDPSFMCAGGEKGKDTCQGDGGSPLNCEIVGNQFGQHYLAGEVAWGIGCFDPVPGVYVNVAKFRHWIDKAFDDRHLEKSFYIPHGAQ